MNTAPTPTKPNILKRTGAAVAAVATLALGACGIDQAPKAESHPAVVEQPATATPVQGGEAPASTERPSVSELVGSSQNCKLERTDSGELRAVISFPLEERPEAEAGNRTIGLIALENTAGVNEVMRSNSEFSGLEEADFKNPSSAVYSGEISMDDYQGLGGKLKEGVNTHVYIVDNLPAKDFALHDSYVMGDGVPLDMAEQFTCDLTYAQVPEKQVFNTIG